MKTKNTTIHGTILLFLILAASLAALFYWGTQKEGYHVDEMYMYGTANSEYLPFMHLGEQEYSVKDWMHEYGAGSSLPELFSNLKKDIGILKDSNWKIKESKIYKDYRRAQACSNEMYTTTWMDGQAYRDYLCATTESRFNYVSVLYNFRGDNHPPLYALLLHTVCSFFPGQFSKWTGLGLNAVIVLLTILLIYVTVRDYLGGERLALMVAACYGLSTAAAHTGSFIRMYGLLTLMVVGFVYSHLRLQGADWELSRENSRILGFFTLFGYLTQYYFVFFAFGLALTSIIILIAHRNRRTLSRYLLVLVRSAVLGIVLWPFSLKAVFAGSRGDESISGLFSPDGTLSRLSVMLNVLSENTVGVPGLVFLGFLLLCGIALLILMLVKKGEENRISLEKGAICAVPFILYFVTVSKMIPYLVDRYIMCLFPWCFILSFGAFALLLHKCGLSEKLQTVLLCGFFLLLMISSDSFRVGNDYLFEGGQENDRVAANTDCVYVLPADWWNQSAEDTLLLSKCRKSAVVREGDFESLAGTYRPVAGSTLLFIVREGLDADADVAGLIKLLPEDGYKLRLKENSREQSRGRILISYSVE
ncbi:MAG: glycosyltransferase family 39 protein [Lachnospiraceae bacterium]|nr:glycosyltransferase family 39 protein [Lachnospiraceae bacterium]